MLTGSAWRFLIGRVRGNEYSRLNAGPVGTPLGALAGSILGRIGGAGAEIYTK